MHWMVCNMLCVWYGMLCKMYAMLCYAYYCTIYVHVYSLPFLACYLCGSILPDKKNKKKHIQNSQKPKPTFQTIQTVNLLRSVNASNAYPVQELPLPFPPQKRKGIPTPLNTFHYP